MFAPGAKAWLGLVLHGSSSNHGQRDPDAWEHKFSATKPHLSRGVIPISLLHLHLSSAWEVAPKSMDWWHRHLGQPSLHITSVGAKLGFLNQLLWRDGLWTGPIPASPAPSPALQPTQPGTEILSQLLLVFFSLIKKPLSAQRAFVGWIPLFSHTVWGSS